MAANKNSHVRSGIFGTCKILNGAFTREPQPVIDKENYWLYPIETASHGGFGNSELSGSPMVMRGRLREVIHIAGYIV